MNRRMIARRFALATMAITAASLAQCYDNLSSPIDWLTYDARAKLRAALPEPDDLATNLAAVFFDDVAVEKVNDGSFSVAYAPATNAESARALYPRVWPWPRFIHGQIVRELKAQGAAAIGFDVLFSEQSEPRRDETTIDPVHGPLSSDQFFAVKMREAGNVFLGVQEGDMLPARVFATNAAGLGSIQSRSDYAVLRRVRPFDEVREWNPILQRYVKALDLNLRHGEVDGMMLSIPIRSGKPSRTNIFEVPLNTNGTLKLTRKGDLDVKDDPQDEGSQSEAPFVTRRVWTLGLQLAAKALGIELSQAEVSEEEIILPADSSGRKRRIPVDQDGMMLIDWLIRYPDVRNGRTPILDGSLGGLLFNDKMRSQGESAKLAAQFANRVVIIGSVARGNNMSDLGATPLEAQAPLVTKHLNVANSVMTGRFVRTSSRTLDVLIIAAVGWACVFITMFTQPIVASVASLLLMLTYAVGAVALFVNYLYVVPMILPMMTAFAVTHLCILVPATDSRAVAKKFFVHAGFKKVEVLRSGTLLLHPKAGQTLALAWFWEERHLTVPAALITALHRLRVQEQEVMKVYLIYQGEAPKSETVQLWREELGCEVIPLFGAMLEKALAEQNYERQLRQLEEPYLVRADPYAEFKPFADPTWFYGRSDLVENLPAALAQGQHIGIFGLREVGKTSQTNQLRQRFVATPTVFLDCQSLPAKAERYFDAIYRDLHTALRAQGIRRLPKLLPIQSVEDFSERVVALFRCWLEAGQREPFILLLDEIDKFFPSPEIRDREEILSEYVRFFRVIRGLAQAHQCLVTCVIAYRPSVNRQNLLTPAVGENPMFNSFQEVYLGFLDAEESEQMTREIGLWKNISWLGDSAQQVFKYCGGHPLISRYFASHACKKGQLKEITPERVLESARDIEKNLRRNEIGNYYKEAIGDLLFPEEMRALLRISRADISGLAESELSAELESATNNLENFGLVQNTGGKLRISAELFRAWLQRRDAPEGKAEILQGT